VRAPIERSRRFSSLATLHSHPLGPFPAEDRVQAIDNLQEATVRRAPPLNAGKNPLPCGTPPSRASLIASGVAAGSLYGMDHLTPTPATSRPPASQRRPRHRAATPVHSARRARARHSLRGQASFGSCHAVELGRLTGPSSLRFSSAPFGPGRFEPVKHNVLFHFPSDLFRFNSNESKIFQKL
jgi:hypothetical protein